MRPALPCRRECLAFALVLVLPCVVCLAVVVVDPLARRFSPLAVLRGVSFADASMAFVASTLLPSMRSLVLTIAHVTAWTSMRIWMWTSILKLLPSLLVMNYAKYFAPCGAVSADGAPNCALFKRIWPDPPILRSVRPLPLLKSKRGVATLSPPLCTSRPE